jgi:hypothetical protein
VSSPDETTGAAEAAQTPSFLEQLRWLLFVAVSLALPLFAFPPFGVWGKPVDLATIFATLFVLLSLPALRRLAVSRQVQLLLVGVLVVPLLALIPPRPSFFAPRQFALSYAHWMLVTFFFLCSLTLLRGARSLRRLLIANVSVGVLVSAFGLYQSYGWSRQWPATRWILLPIQREPFRFALIGGHLRPTSVFLEPAWLAGYLAWIVGLALVLLTAEHERPGWVWPALALLVSTLVATLSWGGYADLLAVVLALVLSLRPSKTALRKTLMWGSAGLFVLLALVLFSPAGHRVKEVASDRFRLLRQTLAERSDAPTGMADSAWVRYRGVQRSIQFLARRPIRGVGLGQYALAAREAGQSPGFANAWCGWIASASEMGVLGPVLLLGALLLGFRRMQRLPAGSWRRAGTAACLAFAMVAQIHTGSYVDLWWWFPVALAVVISASPSLSESAAVAGISS